MAANKTALQPETKKTDPSGKGKNLLDEEKTRPATQGAEAFKREKDG